MNKKAKSLQEFIGLIDEIHKSKGTAESYFERISRRTIYRGHSNNEWSLFPSLFREDSHFIDERIYLKEFIRTMPDELFELEYFDILVKAQHYGIPTRLLDFTLNPLIALFFACASDRNKDKDGSVIIVLNQQLIYSDDTNIDILMHYIFKFKISNLWHIDMIEDIHNSIIHESGICIKTEMIIDSLKSDRPLFVLPNLKNIRVSNQNGVFALFNTSFNFEECHDTYSVRLPSSYSDDVLSAESNVEILKVIIPKDCKDLILEQLNLVGISKATLFPGLQIGLEEIVQRISRANIEFKK